MIPSGTVLQNRYAISRVVGEGGMGAVYETVDRRFGGRVAVKQCLVGEPHLRKAFEREARILNGLRHPSLPRVTDYFDEGDSAFLVMDYIPGDDLFTVLEKRKAELEPRGKAKPFELSEVLSWADQLLGAIGYLHSLRTPVIHRDIKPRNLKVGATGTVVLLDFGLAKQANTEVRAHSPRFSPYEQVTNQVTDERSDLYSLAATLYYLLTGAPPADPVLRAGRRSRNEPDPLVPAETLNHAIPTSLATALRCGLAVEPEGRPQTATDLRAMLWGQAGGADESDWAPTEVGEPPGVASGRTAEPTVERAPTGIPAARQENRVENSTVDQYIAIAGSVSEISLKKVVKHKGRKDGRSGNTKK